MEQQFYLGNDEGAEIDYGSSSPAQIELYKSLREQVAAFGLRRVARESGVARRTIARFIQGKNVRDAIIAKIRAVLKKG